MTEETGIVITAPGKTIKIKKFKKDTLFYDVFKKVADAVKIDLSGWCITTKEGERVYLERNSRRVCVSKDRNSYTGPKLEIRDNTPLLKYFNTFLTVRNGDNEIIHESEPLAVSIEKGDSVISFGNLPDLVVKLQKQDGELMKLYKAEDYQLAENWIKSGSNHLFTGINEEDSVKLSFQQDKEKAVGVQIKLHNKEVRPIFSSLSEELVDQSFKGKHIIERKVTQNPDKRGIVLNVYPAYSCLDVIWYQMKNDQMVVLDITKSPAQLNILTGDILYMYTQATQPEKMVMSTLVEQQGGNVQLLLKKLEAVIINEVHPTEKQHQILLVEPRGACKVSVLKMAIFNQTGYLPKDQALYLRDDKMEDEKTLNQYSISEMSQITLKVESGPKGKHYWNEVDKGVVDIHFWTIKKVAQVIATNEEYTEEKLDDEEATLLSEEDPLELEKEIETLQPRKERSPKPKKSRKQPLRENRSGSSTSIRLKLPQGWKAKSIVEEQSLESGKVIYKVTWKGRSAKDDLWFTGEVLKRSGCELLIKKWKKEKHKKAKQNPIILIDDEDEETNNTEKNSESLERTDVESSENRKDNQVMEEAAMDVGQRELVPDRIVTEKEENTSKLYRIRWKDQDPLEDSWLTHGIVEKNYPTLLANWEIVKSNTTKKRKRQVEDDLTWPTKRKSNSRDKAKENIAQICKIKQKEDHFKWVVKMKDGTCADFSGEELLQLQPTMLLQFVESHLKN